MIYFDLHTHAAAALPEAGTDGIPEGAACLAVVNCDGQLRLAPGSPASAGIHPWWVDGHWRECWPRLEGTVRSPQVVAVGECGLDKVRGGAWDEQMDCFEAQVQLAEEVGKPLVIHCVKAFDEVIAMCRGCRVRRIIHGFRGKPQQAAQLMGQGFDLSFGFRFHPESLLLAYGAGRMWLETDGDGRGSIADVYGLACRVLSIEPTDLRLPGTIVS